MALPARKVSALLKSPPPDDRGSTGPADHTHRTVVDHLLSGGVVVEGQQRSRFRDWTAGLGTDCIQARHQAQISILHGLRRRGIEHLANQFISKSGRCYVVIRIDRDKTSGQHNPRYCGTYSILSTHYCFPFPSDLFFLAIPAPDFSPLPRPRSTRWLPEKGSEKSSQPHSANGRLSSSGNAVIFIEVRFEARPENAREGVPMSEHPDISVLLKQ
jgi:hypothetical protein